MAVSATRTDGTDRLATFSNRGQAVGMTAPGVGIYSTVPGGYGRKSGTSMACPHVSGAAAQVLTHVDGVTDNGRARARLRTSAEDLGVPGWDEQFGHGLVDVANALGFDSIENVGR